MSQQSVENMLNSTLDSDENNNWICEENQELIDEISDFSQ